MNGTKSRVETANATFSSVDELAVYLGISRQGAYAALRRGEIPHIRLGKRFIIPRSAVDDWLRLAGQGNRG